MGHSQEYRDNTIIMVNLGKYFHGEQYKGEHVSVDQLPLFNFNGFSMLSWLGENGGVSESDRNHMKDVIGAYGEFPVRIKCAGKKGKCAETSTHLVLPYQYVHKHEKQSGPEFREQFDIPQRPFYCPKCAEEFSYVYSAGNMQKGAVSLPINFTIFKKRGDGWDFTYCNLDRNELHGRLKRIANAILTQGLDIDPDRMDPNSRMRIGRSEARDIVKKLIGITGQQCLFEDFEEYMIKKPPKFIFNIKRTSKKIPGQMSLFL
ncbi:MAG: hypothetical protein NTU57_04730 [Candidatus Aenigmarchaeota archaeon]|nr:hypothetical protein [Candidatus Aenigmarchaeota archaeon]